MMIYGSWSTVDHDFLQKQSVRTALENVVMDRNAFTYLPFVMVLWTVPTDLTKQTASQVKYY